MTLGRLAGLWRSLTFRLALLYLCLFAASVGLIFGGLYGIGVWLPTRDAKAQIELETQALTETYIVEGRQALLGQLNARAAAPARRRAFHAFLDRDGQAISANLPSWPSRPASGWRRIEADLYVDGDEDDHEALTLDHVFDDGARLLVARDIEEISEREELLARAALSTAVLTFFLGIAGGLLMSLAVARRIDSVTSTARRVIGGNLGERVPIRGTGDDFDQLAVILNHMLERNEELVESIRRVSDSVAHELRTPLARLHADLDELARSEDPAEAKRLIAQAGNEAARLQSIFDALLRIARIENGRHELGVRPIDLSALLADAVEFYRPEAEDRSQFLLETIEPGITIEADPDLIFQAVANLLDNALKYTPEGGRVTLAAHRSGDAVSIRVSDNGPGIPEEHNGRVTERFYRVPDAAATDGLGLGLSLVAAVAALHRGSIDFSKDSPGLTAELRLPLHRTVGSAAS
jgi:signal transduction histidine kinase